MATFVISKRLNGNYKYELTSRKGKTIFVGNDFEYRFMCEEEIFFLKENNSSLTFITHKDRKKFYFVITHNNKQLASSRKYTTLLLLKKGMEEVQNTMQNAEILDFSSSKPIFTEE